MSEGANLPPGDLVDEAGPPAQLAVTVVVARPVARGAERYEVLLSERGRGAFAHGLWVFPGGRVDEGDEALVSGADPSVVWIADRFGISRMRARALVGAAVRELAEEAAIVAPGPEAQTLGDDAWAAARAGAFHPVPPSGRLGALARWLPPRLEMRRFDTTFLVAAVPAGVEARADGDELRAHRWVDPAEALAAHRAGALPLLPPTYRSLLELASFPTLAALEAALEGHWPPVNAPVVRAPTPEEGGVVVTEIPLSARPGLDGGRGHPFRFDGARWSPIAG